ARRTDLPTYPFQHQHYWPAATPGVQDAVALGLEPAGHPLLGAAVPLVESDGVVLAGRLSAGTHTWLADHEVHGSVLLPGTAFVELAVRAGDEVGYGRLEELSLGVPLVLGRREAVRIQVVVGTPDETGRRSVSVYSRPDVPEEDAPWTQHASGTLVEEESPGEALDVSVWPPAGARPVDLDGFYEDRAEDGFSYGPVFRGLRAVWRRGDEVFVEVALPEQVPVRGFGLHPALLDSVLHAAVFTAGEGTSEGGMLPFAWEGVSLYASGASTVRARLVRAEAGGIAVTVVDQDGNPVAAIDGLVVRPAGDRLLTDRRAADDLYRVEWTPTTASGRHDGPLAVVGQDGAALAETLGAAAYAELAELPEETDVVLASVTGDGTSDDILTTLHVTTARVLRLVQQWLDDERHARARLVLVTAGLPGPVLGAVRGLLRAVWSEHPGRVTLLDMAGEPLDTELATRALALDEPEIAVRDERLAVPRLVRVAAPPATADVWGGSGAVLVTGGTGGLGAVVAR
ncbi:polyketide synthase dehydratase domain-containing protein, partial [Streptomyces glaucus]|uniref:polyketide synthase dehydratase domain-containing protein n=1 Tax=Streptomyces glaucus TaxID=284029 RepID=UPI0031D916D2